MDSGGTNRRGIMTTPPETPEERQERVTRLVEAARERSYVALLVHGAAGRAASNALRALYSEGALVTSPPLGDETIGLSSTILPDGREVRAVLVIRPHGRKGPSVRETQSIEGA